MRSSSPAKTVQSCRPGAQWGTSTQPDGMWTKTTMAADQASETSTGGAGGTKSREVSRGSKVSKWDSPAASAQIRRYLTLVSFPRSRGDQWPDQRAPRQHEPGG